MLPVSLKRTIIFLITNDLNANNVYVYCHIVIKHLLKIKWEKFYSKDVNWFPECSIKSKQKCHWSKKSKIQFQKSSSLLWF